MTAPDPLQAIVERSNERFLAHQNKIFVETDRIFAWLMLGQWLFGILR
jgi:hypothetical protein